MKRPQQFLSALTLALTCSVTPLLAQDAGHDDFYWMDRMNRASAIVLLESEVIDQDQAKTIAVAINAVNEDAADPDFPRGGYYLGLEPNYLAAGGPEVSRLHTGRSTIDMGGTSDRMQYRELILEASERMIEARRAMLDFAAKNPNAIIPAYTLGVQAQPISLGHYMTAYAEAFSRHAELLQQTYDNVNASPMGSAALGTSSYPIDRLRLSELLGFDDTIRNSFDAALVANVEAGMRIVGAAAAISVTSSSLIADLEIQYRMVQPYITFPVEMTTGSSIMPQKINPTGLYNTRRQTSNILGNASLYTHYVTRAPSGDTYTVAGGPKDSLKTTITVLKGLTSMFSSFKFDEERALEEVLGDYATATEFANDLQRLGGLPFREAHHVAAELVQFGRDNNLRATEISFEQFQELYSRVSSEKSYPSLDAGFTEEAFKLALRPENMVASSQGYGGPQPAEVQLMLEEGYAQLSQDAEWVAAERARLAEASAALDAAFLELLQ